LQLRLRFFSDRMDERALEASGQYTSFADDFDAILREQADGRVALRGLIASRLTSAASEAGSPGEEVDAGDVSESLTEASGGEDADRPLSPAAPPAARPPPRPVPRTPPKAAKKRSAPVGYGPLSSQSKFRGAERQPYLPRPPDAKEASPRPSSTPRPSSPRPSDAKAASPRSTLPPLHLPPVSPPLTLPRPPTLLLDPATLPVGFPPALPMHGGPPLMPARELPADLAIDWNSPEAIRIEQAITFTYGRKFADRGPPPPGQGGPDVWRNQQFREHSNRWGNRGGKHRHEWTSWFQGGKGKSSNPTASSSGTGDKGKGKTGDKGTGNKGKGTGDKGKGTGDKGTGGGKAK
jgi:hypothetical protein